MFTTHRRLLHLLGGFVIALLVVSAFALALNIGIHPSSAQNPSQTIRDGIQQLISSNSPFSLTGINFHFDINGSKPTGVVALVGDDFICIKGISDAADLNGIISPPAGVTYTTICQTYNTLVLTY